MLKKLEFEELLSMPKRRSSGKPPQGAFADEEFKKEMFDMLTRKKSGNAAEQIMQGGLSHKFNELTKQERYYPFHDDLLILNQNAQFYADLARNGGTYEEPVTLIELGPGAAFEKSRALIQAFRPDNYVAVDASFEALYSNAESVIREFPDVKRYSRKRNFYTEDITIGMRIGEPQDVHTKRGDYSKKFYLENLPEEGRRIVAQMGTTLGNMEGFYDGPMPRDAVIQALTHIRGFMKPGDIGIFSIDQAQDEDVIRECYLSEVNEQLANRTLERVKDELPVFGFRPEYFQYLQVWNPDNHLYGHGWIALEDNHFTFSRQLITVNKNEIFLYANSYRYPQSFMDDVFEASGFRLTEILTTPAKRIHHQVVLAV